MKEAAGSSTSVDLVGWQELLDTVWECRRKSKKCQDSSPAG